jgi:hypothetical protein
VPPNAPRDLARNGSEASCESGLRLLGRAWHGYNWAVTAVAVESGPKKAFAWALDWPGWCRSAKDDARAIEALARYASRYATVADLAGQDFDASVPLQVVERVDGNSSTDFGIPAMITPLDRSPTTDAEAERFARLLAAVWKRFDMVAQDAPAELRKGPRGGGRDTARVVAHVVASDHGYARNIGLKLAAPAPTDLGAVAEMRAEVLKLLGQGSNGAPLARKWTARYALRYIAWHALDHAWEIEDRSNPA